jgi:hypothetical protein
MQAVRKHNERKQRHRGASLRAIPAGKVWRQNKKSIYSIDWQLAPK